MKMTVLDTTIKVKIEYPDHLTEDEAKVYYIARLHLAMNKDNPTVQLHDTIRWAIDSQAPIGEIRKGVVMEALRAAEPL